MERCAIGRGMLEVLGPRMAQVAAKLAPQAPLDSILPGIGGKINPVALLSRKGNILQQATGPILADHVGGGSVGGAARILAQYSPNQTCYSALDIVASKEDARPALGQHPQVL